MTRTTGRSVGACAALALATALQARPDIEFVTIGDPGNPGNNLPSPPGHLNVLGRGKVDYEYRIGKYEVTTAQWMEFVNNYSVLGGPWTFFAAPSHWGAVSDPSYTGPGERWVLSSLPNAGMMPVYGISWREAAMFANWLHNDKSPELWAIKDGAYDTSTFVTTNPSSVFHDQRTHHPDAKYWIPTFDEHTKATHYDPDRHGPGQPGYWMFSHRSDEPVIGGPPGIGQANTGFTLPGFGHLDIPLGSYPETQSPWGLLDTAGMGHELTEFYWPLSMPSDRGSRGSGAGFGPDPWDRIYAVNAFAPHHAFPRLSVRIAAAIPAPACAAVVVPGWFWCGWRQRRRGP